MIKGITVKKLLRLCQQEVSDGNGDRVIAISQDDEGNGFHTLYFGFSDDPQLISDYDYDPGEYILLG